MFFVLFKKRERKTERERKEKETWTGSGLELDNIKMALVDLNKHLYWDEDRTDGQAARHTDTAHFSER